MKKGMFFTKIADDIQELVRTIRDGGNCLVILLTSRSASQWIDHSCRTATKTQKKNAGIIRTANEVLQLLAKAHTPDQIALKMGVTENHTTSHQCIEEKIRHRKPDQLMAMAGHLGLCDPFKTSPTLDHQPQSTSRKMI